MQAAWRGGVVDHDDDYYPAPGHVMLPRPAQRPGPPIWFGGNSAAAQRRRVAMGQGWMAFQPAAVAAPITPSPAPPSVEQLAHPNQRRLQPAPAPRRTHPTTARLPSPP